MGDFEEEEKSQEKVKLFAKASFTKAKKEEGKKNEQAKGSTDDQNAERSLSLAGRPLSPLSCFESHTEKQ